MGASDYEQNWAKKNGVKIKHWAAPKMDRWILRIVTNTEAAVGMLKRGEVTFLADYRGDPQILADLAKTQTEIEVAATVDMGFRQIGSRFQSKVLGDAFE